MSALVAPGTGDPTGPAGVTAAVALAALVVLQLVTGVAYAVDKSAARRGRRRVPERTLLALGLVGGWPGALVAQRMLRHKTRKRSFRRAFALTVAAHLLVTAALVAALVAVGHGG